MGTKITAGPQNWVASTAFSVSEGILETSVYISDDRTETIARVESQKNESELYQRARLIAAAPELLAALIALKEKCGHRTQRAVSESMSDADAIAMRVAYDDAYLAIAKATST